MSDPKPTVSDMCRTLNMQNCSFCDDLQCGDNAAKIDFWTHNPDQEQLDYEDIDDAVQACLDEIPKGEEPEDVQMYGFARENPPDAALEAKCILEVLIEALDDEYGDPEGGPSEVTPAMEAAAKEFVEKVLADYRVWRCRLVGSKTINLKAWMEEQSG